MKNTTFSVIMCVIVLLILVLNFVPFNLNADDGRNPEPSGGTKFYQTRGALKKMKTWGSYGVADGKIYGVTDIYVAQDGTIFLTQFNDFDETSRVQHFTADGTFIKWFGGDGPGIELDQRLIAPAGVACSPDYTLFVTQSLPNELKQFDYDGIVKTALRGVSTFYAKPDDIAIDPEGYIYYIDGFNFIVHKYTPEGELVWSYSNDETANLGTVVTRLYNVIVGADGNIYISDYGFDRILVLNKAGKLIGKIGTFGYKEENINNPFYLAPYFNGDFFIVERRANKNDNSYAEQNMAFIYRFSADGTYIGRMRLPGEATKDYINYTHQPIATGPDGSLYLVEHNAEREIGRVTRYMPAPFKPKGATGKILGSIKGFDKSAIQYLTVRIEGEQDGVAFFGTVRPKSSGKFLIKRFPVGVDFTLTLVGLNTTRFKCKPVTGTGEKKSKGNNLKVVTLK